MMISRLRTTALAAALALPLAACGSDKTTAPDLTSAQVEDMMDALAEIGSFVYTPGAGAVFNSVPEAVHAAIPVPIDETDPCPAGGTSRVVGTIDMTGGETSFSFTADLTQTFQSCAARSESGTTWTFNGQPKLTWRSTYLST